MKFFRALKEFAEMILGCIIMVVAGLAILVTVIVIEVLTSIPRLRDLGWKIEGSFHRSISKTLSGC